MIPKPVVDDEWGDPDLLCDFILMLRDNQWNHIKVEGLNTTGVETYFPDVGDKYRIVLTRQYATPTSERQFLFVDVYYPDRTIIYHNVFVEGCDQWVRIAEKFNRIEQVTAKHLKEQNVKFQEVLKHWGRVRRAMQKEAT